MMRMISLSRTFVSMRRRPVPMYEQSDKSQKDIILIITLMIFTSASVVTSQYCGANINDYSDDFTKFESGLRFTPQACRFITRSQNMTLDYCVQACLNLSAIQFNGFSVCQAFEFRRDADVDEFGVCKLFDANQTTDIELCQPIQSTQAPQGANARVFDTFSRNCASTTSTSSRLTSTTNTRTTDTYTITKSTVTVSSTSTVSTETSTRTTTSTSTATSRTTQTGVQCSNSFVVNQLYDDRGVVISAGRFNTSKIYLLNGLLPFLASNTSCYAICRSDARCVGYDISWVNDANPFTVPGNCSLLNSLRLINTPLEEFGYSYFRICSFGNTPAPATAAPTQVPTTVTTATTATVTTTAGNGFFCAQNSSEFSLYQFNFAVSRFDVSIENLFDSDIISYPLSLSLETCISLCADTRKNGNPCLGVDISWPMDGFATAGGNTAVQGDCYFLKTTRPGFVQDPNTVGVSYERKCTYLPLTSTTSTMTSTTKTTTFAFCNGVQDPSYCYLDCAIGGIRQLCPGTCGTCNLAPTPAPPPPTLSPTRAPTQPGESTQTYSSTTQTATTRTVTRTSTTTSPIGSMCNGVRDPEFCSLVECSVEGVSIACPSKCGSCTSTMTSTTQSSTTLSTTTTTDSTVSSSTVTSTTTVPLTCSAYGLDAYTLDPVSGTCYYFSDNDMLNATAAARMCAIHHPQGQSTLASAPTTQQLRFLDALMQDVKNAPTIAWLGGSLTLNDVIAASDRAVNEQFYGTWATGARITASLFAVGEPGGPLQGNNVQLCVSYADRENFADAPVLGNRRCSDVLRYFCAAAVEDLDVVTTQTTRTTTTTPDADMCQACLFGTEGPCKVILPESAGKDFLCFPYANAQGECAPNQIKCSQEKYFCEGCDLDTFGQCKVTLPDFGTLCVPYNPDGTCPESSGVNGTLEDCRDAAVTTSTPPTTLPTTIPSSPSGPSCTDGCETCQMLGFCVGFANATAQTCLLGMVNCATGSAATTTTIPSSTVGVPDACVNTGCAEDQCVGFGFCVNMISTARRQCHPGLVPCRARDVDACVDCRECSFTYQGTQYCFGEDDGGYCDVDAINCQP